MSQVPVIVRRWAGLLTRTAVIGGLVVAGVQPGAVGQAVADLPTAIEGAPARPVAILAHRGGGGMAPGNTLPAFAAGLRAGVDYLEMDAQITRDGVVVISHAKTLPPNCRGPYVGLEISSLTFDEVRHMDCGYPTMSTATPAPGSPVPTLDEVMQLVRSSGDTHIRLAIEGKRRPGDARSGEEFAQAIIDAAVRNDLVDRIVLTSKDWTMIRAVTDGQATPRVAVSPIVGDFSRTYLGGVSPTTFGGVMGMTQAYGAVAVTIDASMLDEATVTEAHRRGLLIWAWTPDTTQAIVKAVVDGADGVVTDYPLTARAVLGAVDRQLPDPDSAPLSFPASYAVR